MTAYLNNYNVIRPAQLLYAEKCHQYKLTNQIIYVVCIKLQNEHYSYGVNNHSKLKTQLYEYHHYLVAYQSACDW